MDNAKKETPRIFESEYRFCRILWENEPIRSGELVRLCGEKLGWKPTTTYTVIKRLAERGIVENSGSVVRSLVGRDEIGEAEIAELVDSRFDGSVPAFVA
ncbi:MAG: BlaI/MecI/CopY family transcriptional regulator, partial [Clostridia bacterium]|nr:BlaI/MecI/CopY family transcriptional regulator [Clostridia bacterium]